MATRIFVSVFLTVFLQMLVVAQMLTARADGWLMVEQLMARGEKGGTSFDRHYAMPFDFAIIAPFIGLTLFLCWSQWGNPNSRLLAAIIAIAVTIGCLWLWKGGHEAHAHGGTTAAGYLHGVFVCVAMWGIIMLVVFTPRPEPVLLLVLCVVVPAFLFLGQHMYLGLLNWNGEASTYINNPLRDVMGWSVTIISTGALWWRTSKLIPQSFWTNLG